MSSTWALTALGNASGGQGSPASRSAGRVVSVVGRLSAPGFPGLQDAMQLHASHSESKQHFRISFQCAQRWKRFMYSFINTGNRVAVVQQPVHLP